MKKEGEEGGLVYAYAAVYKREIYHRAENGDA